MTPQLLTVIELERLKEWTPEEWAKWWVEPKYDGARMTYHKGEFFSRTGKPLYNLGHIAAELRVRRGWTFDGEVYGGDWASTMSAACSSKTLKPDNGLKYAIFDCMHDWEWERKDASNTLWARRELVTDYVWGMTHAHSVPFIQVLNYASFLILHTNNLANGCDGTVLKLRDSAYEFKRTRTWLKVKPEQTEDGVVVGMYEGKGKYVGMLGGLIVDFGGVTTNVSGMSDAQRREWWGLGHTRQIGWAEHPSNIIGKTIEVKCRGKHKSGCLIEPRYERIREDK